MLVLLVCLTLAACGGGDDDRDGPNFEIGVRDTPYKVTYRLDDKSSSSIAATTDVVWVRQPFESRLESSSDGTLHGVQIAAIDRLRLGTVDEPLIIARVPGLAVSDVRVRPLLDDALDAGLLERGALRSILGRRCQVLRSGTLLGAGPLVPITKAEHADSCIDNGGLLLEETLFSNGKATLHRVATDIDASPRMSDDLFEIGDFTAAADKGAGSSLPVDPTKGALGSFWTLDADAVPRGFTQVGRFGIVPPQSDRFAIPDNPAIIAGTADVFVRDTDFVVVWQGGSRGGVDAFPPIRDAIPVDGGALGDGEAELSALGNEVRFARPHGKFVHVIGTLAVDTLTAIARDLRETQGTGLVYLR